MTINTVADLIADELTDEEKVLLELDIKKKKYKLLTKYLDSKECKALIKKYVKKWDKILKEIEAEIDKRRTEWGSKATVSELDKSIAFYDFQVELSKDLWDSEAELILKEDLTNNAENTYTHIVNKIEELYDVPSFSDLDLLKNRRIEYALIQDRLETMTSFYLDKQIVNPNDNPYEEEKMSKEEFDALTDVK